MVVGHDSDRSLSYDSAEGEEGVPSKRVESDGSRVDGSEERKEGSLLRVARGPTDTLIDELVDLPVVYVGSLGPKISSDLSTNLGSDLDVLDDVADDLGQNPFFLHVAEAPPT